MPRLHTISISHSITTATASSFPAKEWPSRAAAPVAAKGSSVVKMDGDSPALFAFVGANAVVPVEVPVTLESPSVGNALPYSGIGTFGVGNASPATVCKPV